MRTASILVGLALALTALSPAVVAAQAPAAAEPAVVAEARAFMAAYGAALLAGDRAGVAARYSRDGSYFVGRGQNTLEDHASTVAFYAGAKWQPPEAFTWNNLAYEPLGPDAVVVTGTFTWDPKGEVGPRTIAYTALLRREDGGLRIRLEHE